MTPRQRQILKEVSRRSGIPIAKIRSHSRNAYVVLARNEVMKRLDEFHYSLSQIGRVVNRDHSTVCFALGRMAKKKPTGRGWHRPRIRHLDCPGCRYCQIKERHHYLIPYAGVDDDYVPTERPL